MDVAIEGLHKAVPLVIHTMECAEDLFGKNRACLMFQMND
jgi:hypothetical protein